MLVSLCINIFAAKRYVNFHHIKFFNVYKNKTVEIRPAMDMNAKTTPDDEKGLQPSTSYHIFRKKDKNSNHAAFSLTFDSCNTR